MKKILPVLALLTTVPGLAQSNDVTLKNFQFGGWGFIRHETKENADYRTSNKDKTQFTQTRLNFFMRTDLAENYGYVFLAPQFSKISGQNEMSQTSGNLSQTSGSLQDPRLDMHEAYFAIRPTQDEQFYLFLGRQELNYGDHLVVGSVPWHRIGRSFDGARARYKFSDKMTLDGFLTKLQDNNVTANGLNGQDSNFYGLYLAGSLGGKVKEADAYILRKDNQTTGSFKDTNAYGVRLKSRLGESFDYRIEGTVEQVRLSGANEVHHSEHQYNVEIGYTFPVLSTRLGAEYFVATEKYDQLFPTAHKFLGYADQFSRRNLKGYSGHLSLSPYDKITFSADYHIFNRYDKSTPAYDFSGASLGSTGSSKDLAQELDLILAYNFTKTLQMSYGHSWVAPGKYLKDQNSAVNAETQWSYLQLLARF